MGQGHETVNFGGQEVKDQGHTRPDLDLKSWRRHHFRSYWVEYLFQMWFIFSVNHGNRCLNIRDWWSCFPRTGCPSWCQTNSSLSRRNGAGTISTGIHGNCSRTQQPLIRRRRSLQAKATSYILVVVLCFSSF